MKNRHFFFRLSVTLLTVFSLYSVWMHSLGHLEHNDKAECQQLIHANLDSGETSEEISSEFCFVTTTPVFKIKDTQNSPKKVQYQKPSRAPPIIRFI